MQNRGFNLLEQYDFDIYDPSYVIKFFSGSINEKIQYAKKITEEVCSEVIKQSSVISQVLESKEKGYRYVVDLSEKALKDIEDGAIKLSTDKNGNTFAQFRLRNGQYGSHIPIKKEMIGNGIDFVQMANAMQIQALQAQIEKISEQLTVIDQSVKEVMQGQQNDRMGLYYSGLSLYMEASDISDKDLKNMLITQALKSLSESSYQLMLTMQTDIDYLVNKEYESIKGKQRVYKIDEHMKRINHSFYFVHNAMLARAAIYCKEGHLSAMSNVLEQYSRFIENTIVKNANLLSECDLNDNGTSEGIWKTRAKLQLNVVDVAKHLKSSDKTVYISISEGVA